MKGEKVIRLKEHKDLESYVVELCGRDYKFFRNKYADGVYVIDLRPYGQRNAEKQMPLFKAGYGKS